MLVAVGNLFLDFQLRQRKPSRGGVILYIHSRVYPCAIQTEIIKNVDLIFVELRNHNNKVIVSLIYRPPGQTSEIDYLT